MDIVSINHTCLILIGNFLVLLFVLNQILYRPIRRILKERRETIQGLEEGAENAVQSAAEKEDSFAQGIRDARVRGMKEKEALIQEASDEEKAMTEKIHASASAELAKVRERIAKDADSVRAALEKEVDAFAEGIGAKILGRAL